MACSAVTPVAEVLKGLVKQRWELAGRLLQKAIQLKHQAQIRGMQRTERKIKAERAFLESVSKKGLLYVVPVFLFPFCLL